MGQIGIAQHRRGNRMIDGRAMNEAAISRLGQDTAALRLPQRFRYVFDIRDLGHRGRAEVFEPAESAEITSQNAFIKLSVALRRIA